MLSITKQLPLIILSGSPSLMSAEETDVYETTGSNTPAIIVFRTQYETGDSVTMQWNSNNETFTAVATVTEPGNQVLGNDVNPLSIEYWGNAFVEMLKKNPRVMRDFKLQYTFLNNTYYIILKPYTHSPDYDLIWSEDSDNEAFTLQNGTNLQGAYHQNQTIGFQLYKQSQSVNYQEFSRHRNTVNINTVISNAKAVATYDISRLMVVEKYNHFTFPTVPDLHIEHAIIEVFTPYLFSSWGSPPLERTGIFGDKTYALPGALSDQQLASLNSEGRTFYDKLISDQIFLSYAPKTKYTDIYTPERLYYLSLKDQTIYTRVQFYFADGTNQQFNRDAFVSKANTVYEVVLGFFDIIEDLTNVVKYEVRLLNNYGETLTKTYTFILDYTHQQFARYFLFKNRLGTYEAVRFTGKAQKNVEGEKETVSLIKDPARNLKTQSSKQVSSQVITSITLNTGYQERQWLNYLAQELPVSEHVLWLKQGKAVNVNISNASVVVEEDGNDLPNFDITFTTDELADAFYEEFGIELPVAGDFNEDFNEDFYDN